MDGLLLIDKPKGLSSFRVVSRVRGIIQSANGQKCRVGHSGTLDPAASGLLLLAIGSYTKRLPELVKMSKSYEAVMRLGELSDSGDSEGNISHYSDERPVKQAILKVFMQFLGPQLQKPPAFSAIKIHGQRAYKLARQGGRSTYRPGR